MENQNELKKPNIVVIIAVIAVFIFLTGIMMVLNKNRQKQLSNLLPVTSPVPSPTPIREKGSLILKADKTKYALNETITINVFSNSDSHLVTGYDIVLIYDKNAVKFLSHNNLDTNFQTFVSAKDNKINLTGVKKLSTRTGSVFNNMSIVELTFKPLKSGQTKFDLEFIPGSKKESNIIDNNNSEVLGKVEGVTVLVD